MGSSSLARAIRQYEVVVVVKTEANLNKARAGVSSGASSNES